MKKKNTGKTLKKNTSVIISDKNLPEHIHTERKAVLNRVARVTGHMKAIKKMVEDERDCSEILIQLSAIRAAVNNIGRIILEDHIHHCVVEAVKKGNERVLDDLDIAVARFLK